MIPRDLSKDQSDAAHAAAAVLIHGNPNRAECRRQYADALLELEQMLVEPADAPEIIREAMRWQMRNAIAEILELEAA